MGINFCTGCTKKTPLKEKLSKVLKRRFFGAPGILLLLLYISERNKILWLNKDIQQNYLFIPVMPTFCASLPYSPLLVSEPNCTSLGDLLASWPRVLHLHQSPGRLSGILSCQPRTRILHLSLQTENIPRWRWFDEQSGSGLMTKHKTNLSANLKRL